MKISRKILLTILAAAAITTSCADKFSISGTLPAAVKADSVYLYPVDMSSTPVPICAVPVENGQFSIKGLVPDTVTLAVGSEKTEMVIARWAIRSVEDVSVENEGELLN